MKRDTRQTTLDVSMALHERDNRIRDLERDLRALRVRRPEGVVLIGGPRHGSIEPVYVDEYGTRTFEVVIPPDPEVARRYTATELAAERIRVGVYFLERVSTYDGPRWVGVWRGSR